MRASVVILPEGARKSSATCAALRACPERSRRGRRWTSRTGQLTSWKYSAGGWHTLLARAAGGRLEFYVDNALIATWVDTTPLPAYGFGLMTIDGAASFDNVKVYGLSTRTYYAFGAARVAERTTTHWQAAGSGAAPGGGVVYYLAADHLGSTSLALTTGGVVTGTRAYYMPYGAERGPAASLPTDFTFTGGRTTGGLGLTHLGARFYDFRLSQWLSADTIAPSKQPQDLNRYAYASNNPVRYRDPSGHCSENMSNIQKANDQCWLKYYEVSNMLNLGAVAGLSALDYNALSVLGASLEKWQNRGIVFQNGATSWGADGISTALNGLDEAEAKFGSWDKMRPFLGISQDGDTYTLGRDVPNQLCTSANTAGCGQRTRADFANDPSQDLFLHELGHTVDEWLGTQHGTSDYGYWSTAGHGLEGLGWDLQGTGQYHYADGHRLEVQEWVYSNTNNDAPGSTTAPSEDFADSFLVWVVGAHGAYDSLSQRRQDALDVALLGP